MNDSLKYSLLLLALLLVSHCNSGDKHDSNNEATQEEPQPQDIKLQTFKSDTGWGYNILIDDKIYVHQPHIPAIPGNRGFKSQEKALFVGNAVLTKVKNGIIPPSLTKEEVMNLLQE